jgi:16S rRNA (cytosine967-C5)-methyltransferase
VAQPSARQVALAALRTWRTEKRFADSIISRLPSASKLRPVDRAFALELFYGVLRNLTLLDFWIGSFRPGRIDFELRDILRLGFYQLLVLATPPHAAVHETVELARKKHRPLINAILRTASRRVEDLERGTSAQPWYVQFSHPRFLLERWKKNFGLEAALDLCRWNNRPAPLYARINRIKTSPEKFLRVYPDSVPLPDHENFVGIGEIAQKAMEQGECYIQDPSTAIACKLLDPQPGEKILDACAAPGGKTGYLGELMENRGIIVACDREPNRVKRLEENVRRLGVEIARIFRHDWLGDATPPAIASLRLFDRILLDTPCSNTGVMRRRPDVRWRLRPADFLRMQKRQLDLINSLTRFLKPGGSLVYSTCSLEPEENEKVVQQLLAKTPVLQLEEQKRCSPFQDHLDGAFAAKFMKAV